MTEVTEEIGSADVTVVGRLVMGRPVVGRLERIDVTEVGTPGEGVVGRLGRLVARLLVGSRVMILPRESVERDGSGVGVIGRPVVGTRPAEEAELRMDAKEEVIPVGRTLMTELGSTPRVTGLATGLAEDKATRAVKVAAMYVLANILLSSGVNRRRVTWYFRKRCSQTSLS